jgi:signal peptidase II
VRRPTGLFAATAIVVVVFDQVTKALIRANLDPGESIPLIDGIVDLTHVRNTGAAFGLLPGNLTLFIVVALAVLGLVGWVWWRLRPTSRSFSAALGLVAGGAVGNLIDRVLLGRVTDFVDFGWFPVFNAADVALDLGVAIIVWRILFGTVDEREPSVVEEEVPGAAAP